MGMQISRSICAEKKEKAIVRSSEEIFSKSVSRVIEAKGLKNHKWKHGARSCTHVVLILPKYSVSEVIRHIKGKSAIAIARQFGNKKRNFNGEQFWARSYAVSTVGFEEEKIKEYKKHQEQLDGLGSEELDEF